MQTITAIVHTKNSEKTLDACLSSLEWCNEVFVVDMASTDATIHIAKKHKATIFHVTSNERFADPIRQEYLKKVTTDWTLIIDSDEEVPVTLANKISELMLTQGVDGYSLPRKNIIFGKWIQHSGFWPDYIVRLFKTGKGSYPPYVHVQPTIEGVSQKLQADEKFAIVHHHYDSIEQFILRLNVYTSLEAKKLVELHAKNPQDYVLPTTRFLQEFFNQFFSRYFDQKGYRDGVYGVILSLLMATYMMIVAMKVWEITKKEVNISLEDIEQEVTDACQATSYWVANEKLQTEKNALHKLSLKIRRKLHS